MDVRHQRGSPAAGRPPAPRSEDSARLAGRRRPEFDREGGGCQPQRQMSASGRAGGGWSFQTPPSARTRLPHHLCSQRGRATSSLADPEPGPCARGAVQPGCWALAASTFPAGKAPRGARHGNYLEWQRSSRIGSVAEPGVGRNAGSQELGQLQHKIGRRVLADSKAPGLHARPGLRRSAGMTPAGCPRVRGARGRKDPGSVFSPANFALNLGTLRTPGKAAASGRPGPASLEGSRRAGPAMPRADPAAPSFVAAARSLARRSAPAARPLGSPPRSPCRRRRHRPLPAGHAPAETRAVSWTAARALPISAARPPPRLRAAPPPASRPEAPAGEARGPATAGTQGCSRTLSIRLGWARAASCFVPLEVA